MTENQIKWILRLGAEFKDDIGLFTAYLLIALQNNLLPDTEPTFDGNDVESVLEIIEEAKKPEKVKAMTEIITKINKTKEEIN